MDSDARRTNPTTGARRSLWFIGSWSSRYDSNEAIEAQLLYEHGAPAPTISISLRDAEGRRMELRFDVAGGELTSGDEILAHTED